MTQIPAHFQIPADPVAYINATIATPQARFTVLSSTLIRLESNPGGHFEDRPSQAFWYRRQSVPPFQVRQDNGMLEIETERLLLRYTLEQPFSPENISIQIKASGITWHYGDPDQGNLLGTTRTLDNVDGQAALERGLLSRQGWTVVDDSRSLVFNEQGWLEPRLGSGDALDLYFFGYGKDYAACLADFRKVSGATPLIPRWALGNWWSRYWAFSQQELTDLMLEFAAHQVPLSVCIIDMDWHLTHTGNACSGWTGYTWNRELFPDPPAFLQFLHAMNLKTSLNLHPAEGVHAHEQKYPQMASAVGIDPASKQPVAFEPTDPAFALAYLEQLHHPQEADGVDFWWMDWQQGNPSRLPGLNLLWWINHLHFYELGPGWHQAPLPVLSLGRPGKPPLPDRLFRRHDHYLGFAGFPALLHRHCRQCGLWLVEP